MSLSIMISRYQKATGIAVWQASYANFSRRAALGPLQRQWPASYGRLTVRYCPAAAMLGPGLLI